MKIDPVALRAFLDDMHAHADIRDQRTKSIAGIVTDARGKGVDGKALRKVFVRERMDAEKRQRDDELLTAYEGALGGKGRALRAIEAGVPVEVAAKANGVHRATVARARHGKSHVANEPSNATRTKLDVISPPEVATLPVHDIETGEITPSPVASGVEGCGLQPRQPEPAASLAGEADAPAPISKRETVQTAREDDLVIPHFLRRAPA